MPYAAPPHRSKLDRLKPKTKSNWKRQAGTTTTQRGYGYQWQKKRARILRRDAYLCQTHKRRGIDKEGREVDHIVEKTDGGGDEDANLETICNACHKTKTKREQRRRRQAR